MSAMKDVHAEVMDLLEQSVDDDGLDACACSGEALHAARSFVKAHGDERVRMSDQQYQSEIRARLHCGASVHEIASLDAGMLVDLASLSGLEVRRFAVSLDASHRSHAIRVAAARELGLVVQIEEGVAIQRYRGNNVPFEIPTDLRAELLQVFPMARGLGIGHVFNEGHDAATCPEPDCVHRRTVTTATPGAVA